MAATTAIRTYYQCEACEFGSFEIREIELHMHETHSRWMMTTAVDPNVVVDDSQSLIKTVELDSNELVGEDATDESRRGGDEGKRAKGISTSEVTFQDRLCATAVEQTTAATATVTGRTPGVGYVDSNSDSDTNDVIWSNGAVRLLIALVQQDLDKFNSPTTPKHYLWKGISSKMSERGYNYTHVRCDNKWRSLKKSYRNARNLVRSGKTDAKKWKFYDVMDEFMANHELDQELATSNSVAIENGGMGLIAVDGNETVAGAHSTHRRQSMSTTTKKRRRTTVQKGSSSADEDDEGEGGGDDYRTETNRERRHREKMEQMKRFNDLFELFVCSNVKSAANDRSNGAHQTQ